MTTREQIPVEETSISFFNNLVIGIVVSGIIELPVMQNLVPQLQQPAQAIELCKEGWSDNVKSWKNNTEQDVLLLYRVRRFPVNTQEYWTVRPGETFRLKSGGEFQYCKNF